MKIMYRSRKTLVMLLLATLLMSCFPAHSAVAQGKGNGGGKKGDGGETPTAPLPSVRYRLSIVDLPANNEGVVWVNDVNDVGQAVGSVSINGRYNAAVFDGASGTTSLLADLVDPTTIPEGFYLRSAIGINNYGVVVGYLLDSAETPTPYAVDLTLDSPPVDLLPFPVGISAKAKRINDNGDIAGTYQVREAETSEVPPRSVWHFNPGLYGHPEFRLARDLDSDGFALPVDLTHAEHTVLFEEIGSLRYSTIEINEPDFAAGRPAQILATPSEGAVRHTISDPIVDPDQIFSPFTEIFPELSFTYRIGGINAGGTFAAKSAVYIGKGNKTEVINHIYSAELIQLPVDPYDDVPAGIHDDGQVVCVNGTLFGNWNDGHGDRSVQIDDLVIGSEADLLEWNSYASKSLEWASGQGVIVSKARNDDNTTASVCILTEEAVAR